MTNSRYLLIICILLSTTILHAQEDTTNLEKLRTESGIDPTRVQSRVGYSFLIYDKDAAAGQVNNRASLTLGVNKWSFAMKYEVISKIEGIPGTGFTSGMGDIRLSVLNAFYIKGKHALAAAAEFSMPTGKPGFGSQYMSINPSLTYSYTINPSFIFAIQPQYTFGLMKDPSYPSLSVITIRSFLAKFTKTGYFFVFEPRPVFDLTNHNNDLILSPIMGKSLGAGFNLILLFEYPLNKVNRDTRGVLYQFGFNKNF